MNLEKRLILIINPIFSTIFLIILSPLLLIISLIIFIEDGFPILFVQKRLGKNQIEFNLFKFRSMKVSTPSIETSKLIQPEKYILKNGRFLRKYSLDELPNLLNVLKNEINFIGYRPSLESQRKLNELRKKNGIYNFKPGITGLAQINGRDDISDEIKINYEIKYINSSKFKMNLYIIIQTFYKVFKSENIKF